jgi:hypothetical protein
MGRLEGAVDGLELARGEARQQRGFQRRHARQHVLAPARRGRLLLRRRLSRRLRRLRRRQISHDGDWDWERPSSDGFRQLRRVFFLVWFQQG